MTPASIRALEIPAVILVLLVLEFAPHVCRAWGGLSTAGRAHLVVWGITATGWAVTLAGHFAGWW